MGRGCNDWSELVTREGVVGNFNAGTRTSKRLGTGGPLVARLTVWSEIPPGMMVPLRQAQGGPFNELGVRILITELGRVNYKDLFLVWYGIFGVRIRQLRE